MRSLVVLAILLLVAVVAAAGGASAATSGNANQIDGPTNVSSVEVFVQLETNGDARFSVTTRLPLDDESDEAAFDRLGSEFEAGEDVGYTVGPFRQVAASLSTELGRPMDIENVTRSARTVNGTGELTLAFTWTNFAQIEKSELLLGDVFGPVETPVFTSLDANQRLVIAPPKGYAVDQSSVAVGNGSQLVIEGPRQLDAGDVRVVYVEAVKSTTTTTTTTAGGTDTPDETGTFPLQAAGFLGLLAVVVVALVVLRRRPGTDDTRTTDAALEPTAQEPSVSDSASQEPETQEPAKTEPQPQEPETQESEPQEPTDDVDSDDPFAGVDLDLISDEERVTLLLEANGGRMKQGQIVKETMWSNAKVSQLLSKMAAEDQVNKLRIGRENLISLPDVSLTDPDGNE